MTSFALSLTRLTRQRRPKRRLRETIGGLLLGAILGAGIALFPEWLILLGVAYVGLVHVMCLWDTDVFLRMADLRRFGLERLSLRARAAFWGHYIATDWLLSHVIALSLGLLSAILLGQPAMVAPVASLYFFALIPLPSIVRFGARASKRAVQIYIGGLVLSLVGVSVLVVAQPQTVLANPFRIGAVLVLVGLLVAVILDAVAVRSSGTRLQGSDARRVFAGLLGRHPLLYKDLMLLWRPAAGTMFASAALFALLMISTPVEWAVALAVVCLQENIFMTKDRLGYRILQDETFGHHALPRDRHRLRRHMLRFLALHPLLAWFIVLVIGLATASAGVRELALAALVFAAVHVVDVPRLLDGLGRLGWWRVAVRYSLTVSFTLGVAIGGLGLAAAAVFVGVVGLVYLPSFLTAARPQSPAEPVARSGAFRPRPQAAVY